MSNRFYSERIYDADDFGMIVISDVYCDEWEGTFGEKDFIVDFGVGWFTGCLGEACGPGYIGTYIRNIVQVRGIDKDIDKLNEIFLKYANLGYARAQNALSVGYVYAIK